MTDHISRKELKHDKIKETLEHGAEAVYSHGRMAAIIVLAALIATAAYGGWRIYHDRKTAEANAALDVAMKAYSGHTGASTTPVDPSEPSYPDDTARAQDAANKFDAVANKYSGTTPGKLARYYHALCLEDLEQRNQALEELKKIGSSGDKEIAALAQYQMAVIYSRTGKTDDAIKIYRNLADKSALFVPRPLALLELAAALRQSNPKESMTVYQQVKKEFPDTAMAEEADRALGSISPKS